MEDWGSESGEPPVGGGKRKMVKRRGDTVDIAELLFTAERDFLVKNNSHKVRVDDLIGKTILLYFVPLYEDVDPYRHYGYREAEHTLDLIEAYYELLPLGGVEFVFVPVYPNYYGFENVPISLEAIFNRLISTIPFPAIPFSDIDSCCDRLVKAFSVDDPALVWDYLLPYWVVIDHTSTFVAERMSYPYLFKLLCGAELHPLSLQRIRSLWDENTDPYNGSRCEARKRLINEWDQLLASPTRDYLLSSNGDQVPISSLKDKVVGLYFCENIPHPPNMELIKKVYQEAKSRGYDFEIVQINFHYHIFRSLVHVVDMSVQQCNENISWLTLPFKDPSCRKLQRIFRCNYQEENDPDWARDCLVIIDPRQADINRIPFEFSGAEILEKYGVEGYPFTRQYLYEIEIEYRTQEKRLKLQSFFPPGLCHLIRPAGDGFDMTDGSQLTGKRVLVLFGDQHGCESNALFMSMLKYKYCEQLIDEAEENKFEVVYVSTDCWESRFAECIIDMPWLVHPYSPDSKRMCEKMTKLPSASGIEAAAFDMDGELIAKEWLDRGRVDTSYKLRFPFISQDWKERIRLEVEWMCHLCRYYYEIP